MKTSDFYKKLTSAQLQENLEKQFGSKVNLAKYDREQLEDIRNKLRTRVFQQEGNAGINDLLTNEAYQKDKAMLELLNTRIKEMLGENIKNLRNKMVELSEAKKAKPDFLDMDKDGDKKEPMKKAIADKKEVKETFDDYQDVGSTKKTSSGTATKTASGMKHAGKYGSSYDANDDSSDTPAKPSKAAKTSAEKKADTAKDIKLPAWKGTVTKHSMKEGSVKALDADLKDKSMSDDDFKKKYKMTRAECRAELKSKQVDEAAKPSAGMTAKEKSAVAKKAAAGKDIGKPGKGFEKVEKAAAKGGAKDPKAVAAAAMWKSQAKKKHSVSEGIVQYGAPANTELFKVTYFDPKYEETRTSTIKSRSKESALSYCDGKGYHVQSIEPINKLAEATANHKHNVKFVNESLGRLLAEDEEGKAKAITAASDIVNDFTSWMQRVGQYQTKSMIELADAIRADFGSEESEKFKQAVGPALAATLEVLTSQREAVSRAVSTLAGEAVPDETMGAAPEMDAMEPEADMDMAPPDEMNPAPEDEFAASDAASGAGATGREMRESKFARKLREGHSIMNSLSK